MLLKVDPSLQPHASPGGTIMVEFNRALYGCIVSAKFWFEKLTDTLKNMGFLPNDGDPCFLTRCRNSVLTTVVALYRTVQDCWTLDLAGHGRNPSL